MVLAHACKLGLHKDPVSFDPQQPWSHTCALHSGLVQDLVQQPAILALLVVGLAKDEGADLDQEAVQLGLQYTSAFGGWWECQKLTDGCGLHITAATMSLHFETGVLYQHTCDCSLPP